MTVYSFDGKHLKSFDKGFMDKYYSSRADIGNPNVIGGLDAFTTYNVVSYVFRCVNIRAQEIARMPRQLLDRAGNDVSENPAYTSLTKNLTRVLFAQEVSRCLAGAAYSLIEANGMGRQPALRWVPSSSVQIHLAPETRRLDYFIRRENKPPEIPLDKIVYLWNFNPDKDNAPGPGESVVSLGESSTLYALDSFVAGYFGSGAVPVTIVPVDPNTQDTDITATQNFWNRRIAGVARAWRYIVMRMRKDNEPFTIGSNVKETLAPELSAEKKAGIAIAHGIPPNIVDGSYKYATADSEYLNFIVGTIIPRVDDTFEIMNEQFYARLGLTLKACPEKLEIMQTMQLAQAQAVQTAVGEPVMRRDEGRAILGLKPEPKPISVASSGTPKPVEVTEGGQSATALNGGLAVSESATILNGAQITSAIGVLNGVAAGTVAKLVAVELLVALGIDKARAEMMVNASLNVNPTGETESSAPKPYTTDTPRPVKFTATPDEIKAALAEWRKAALEARKAGGAFVFPSAPNVIPDDIAVSINAALAGAKTAKAIRAVFERNWIQDSPPIAPAENVDELKRANDLLTQVIALSKGDE